MSMKLLDLNRASCLSIMLDRCLSNALRTYKRTYVQLLTLLKHLPLSNAHRGVEEK